MKEKIKDFNTKKTTSVLFKGITNNNSNAILKKPHWIKTKLPVNFSRIRNTQFLIKKNHLHSICEEASCPNISECFNNGTATFLILGKKCTRRCPFCNVSHGRPSAPDANEPYKLAKTAYNMKLSYVVITSVNRDDLYEGGAQHFSDCISAIRNEVKNIKIEILVPDFRGCTHRALNIINDTPPDVFSHNLESVPRLYYQIRPGSDYKRSLKLLEQFKVIQPDVPTKSSLMLGLGETNIEIIKVMYDLYSHGVRILTIGQYLQPTKYHFPVKRYVPLDEFESIKLKALEIGFSSVACGPLIRSSYKADSQLKNIKNTSLY